MVTLLTAPYALKVFTQVEIFTNAKPIETVLRAVERGLQDMVYAKTFAESALSA